MQQIIIFLAILSMSACINKNDKREAMSTNVEVETNKKEAVNSNIKRTNNMYDELKVYIENVALSMDTIPMERKAQLEEIVSYIKGKKENNKDCNLVFICTHNSRRSHMCQIWAATAAAYYGVDKKIYTYSGGTESTAFNPRAVSAIERAGFHVVNPGGMNPHYQVFFSDEGEKMECFSKKYDDEYNPISDFAAIMTCSDADRNCPFIPGAEQRIAIPYNDPKISDGTPEESATYDGRSKQIATEMLYIMSRV